MSQDGRSFIMGGGAAPPAEGGCSNPITLAIPRPENQRNTNVYVDTPFQHKVSPRREEVFLPHVSSRTPHPHHELPLVHTGLVRSSLHRSHHTHITSAKKEPHTGLAAPQKPPRDIISSQPPATVLTFTKGAKDEDSIICTRCGRCKCEACSVPRAAPSGAWVCGGKCHLSPSTVIDYLSCLCCVKGVLYHCGKDNDEETPAVDRPCSCHGNDACLRWACLALSTLPLPCLLCYWPLTGVRRICEKTYQKFSTHGCRCSTSTTHTPAPTPTNVHPEKRLLNDCV